MPCHVGLSVLQLAALQLPPQREGVSTSGRPRQSDLSGDVPSPVCCLLKAVIIWHEYQERDHWRPCCTNVFSGSLSKEEILTKQRQGRL